MNLVHEIYTQLKADNNNVELLKELVKAVEAERDKYQEEAYFLRENNSILRNDRDYKKEFILKQNRQMSNLRQRLQQFEAENARLKLKLRKLEK